jgi:hypothetical protein
LFFVLAFRCFFVSFRHLFSFVSPYDASPLKVIKTLTVFT